MSRYPPYAETAQNFHCLSKVSRVDAGGSDHLGALLVSLLIFLLLGAGCMTHDSAYYEPDQKDQPKMLEGEFTGVGKVAVVAGTRKSSGENLLVLAELPEGRRGLALTKIHQDREFADVNDELLELIDDSIAAFTLADMDSQGTDDLIAATAGGELLIVPDLNHGPSLDDARLIDLELPAGIKICDIVAGNFDNHGHLDIAVTLTTSDWKLAQSTIFAFYDAGKREYVAPEHFNAEAIERALADGGSARGCFGATAIARRITVREPPNFDRPVTTLSDTKHALLTMDGIYTYANTGSSRNWGQPERDDLWEPQPLFDEVKDGVSRGQIARLHLNDKDTDNPRAIEEDIALLMWQPTHDPCGAPQPNRRSTCAARPARPRVAVHFDYHERLKRQVYIFEPEREQPRALAVGRFGSIRGERLVLGFADGTIQAYKHDQQYLDLPRRIRSIVQRDRSNRWHLDWESDGNEIAEDLLSGLTIGDVDRNGLNDIIASVPHTASLRVINFYHPCIDGDRCASR